VDVCSPLMSYAQSAEAVWPTQGALDDPLPSAEPFARRYAMARDSRCNAPMASALQLVELEKSHTLSRPAAVDPLQTVAGAYCSIGHYLNVFPVFGELMKNVIEISC
jgi:hypothetical protein